MKNSFLPEPLPEAEWKLPHFKGEIDQTLELYYEYARSCEPLQKWIIGGRRHWGVPEEPPEEYKLDLDGMDYRKAVRKFPGWRLFGFIASLDGFPEKPFSECKDIGMKFQFFGNHTSPRGIDSFHPSCFFTPSFTWESLEPVSPDCFTNPLVGPSEYQSSVLSFMGINWGVSDKQLVEDFRHLLKQNRPDEFKKAVEQQRRGLGGTVLPFKKEAALRCLGVWRRIKHLEDDWQNFMEVYYPRHCRLNFRESGKYDEVLRDARRSFEQAEKIFHWFFGEKIKL